MSTQEFPGERETAEVGSGVVGNAQSEAERQSAEAELNCIVAKFAPALLPLVGEIRALLQKRLPTAVEVVYEYRAWFVISYSPNERGYEGVLAIHGSADGVKLYFNRGKDLPDPEKLLKGSGSLVRSIEVADAATLARPAVATLIEQAIAHSSEPFASAGTGSVIIRSTSANKRRRSCPN